MTSTDSTRSWWVGVILGGAITLPLVYSCTSDDRLAPPSPSSALRAAEQSADPFGPQFQVPVPQFNDQGIAPVMTAIVIPPGAVATVTVTGFLTYTANPAFAAACPPPLPAPFSPGNLTTVGPAGFLPVLDPRFNGGYRGGEVDVYESTDNNPPPNGIKLQFQPQDASAGTVTATVQGFPPLGRLWVVRPPSFPSSCGTPQGPSISGFFVSGSQTLSAAFTQKRLQVTVAVSPRDIAPPLNPRCQGTPGKARVSVNASWSDGSSAQGLAVSLRTQFEGGSGGHAHQADDRDGFGHFAQASGQTDVAGSFTTDYVPDSIGALERLTATVSGEGQTTTASAELATRVPGLIELVSGANIELGGATPNHPSNTFGTGFTIGKIVILADTFFQATGVRIPYNDMSLEFGGVFDLNAKFTATAHPGHLGHRCGKEVDVVDKVGDRVAVLEDYLDVLAYSPLIRASQFIRHGAGSYHLTFAR